MHASPPIDAEPAASSTGFWQRLLYRWFVEYNPLYLASAMLVLGGCFLCSPNLPTDENVSGWFGISLISELYAASLLGGAALLTRIGLKRPAVMLTLLVVLYQWDLTAHTETCAYLGAAGAAATAIWLLAFGAKIYALGWAMRIRFARHLLATAMVAGTGLALGPRVLPGLGANAAGALLAAWVFALGALYRPGGVSSIVALDSWGSVVLRRSTRAVALLSAALLGMHVLLWSRDHAIALAWVLPVVPLLFLRYVRGEARMWALLAGTGALVAMTLPGALSITALLAAAAIGVRALWPGFAQESSSPQHAPPQEEEVPYRARAVPVAPPLPIEVLGLGPAERARSLAGAFFSLYVSAWTLGWSGGPWPAHILGLDLVLTVAVVLAVVWRTRARDTKARLALIPLAASYLHFVIQAHLVPAPQSGGQWGACAVALGFALLAGSLATSYRLRAHAHGATSPRASEEESDPGQ